MKRLIAGALVGLVLAVTVAPSAEAGGGRYRGGHGRRTGSEAAIGLGVGLVLGTFLGAAIASASPGVAAPVQAPTPVYITPPPQQWVAGHWETRWSPTLTQLQVWVPGYHDPYGNWIPGHYQTQVVQTGAWTQVWVPGHWE